MASLLKLLSLSDILENMRKTNISSEENWLELIRGLGYKAYSPNLDRQFSIGDVAVTVDPQYAVWASAVFDEPRLTAQLVLPAVKRVLTAFPPSKAVQEGMFQDPPSKTTEEILLQIEKWVEGVEIDARGLLQVPMNTGAPMYIRAGDSERFAYKSLSCLVHVMLASQQRLDINNWWSFASHTLQACRKAWTVSVNKPIPSVQSENEYAAPLSQEEEAAAYEEIRRQKRDIISILPQTFGQKLRPIGEEGSFPDQTK
jgi:hypothetical protein